jgi:glycerol uptake facilitator-like aquaporin
MRNYASNEARDDGTRVTTKQLGWKERDRGSIEKMRSIYRRQGDGEKRSLYKK